MRSGHIVQACEHRVNVVAIMRGDGGQAMDVNAVFEGGGVKGIALAGAVVGAERSGVRFQGVAGTSSGSIVASLLAAGYSGEELQRIINQTPFKTFLKRSPLYNVRFAGPAVRLMWKKGLYSGEALEYWIRKLLLAKGVRTFADLPKGKLKIVASDISNGRIVVLPDDLPFYGADPAQFEVAKAIRMSASIPFFFDPVIIRQQVGIREEDGFAGRFAYIVDGVLLSNFPLWLFEEGQSGREEPVPTIGFQLVGKNANEPHVIRGPFSMLQAIFETMLQAHDERYIEKEYRDRTVKIPTLGVRSTQFELREEVSARLFESGREKTEAFFRTFFIR